MHTSTRLGRSGISQRFETGTMVSTLQLVTVPSSRDSLDTARGREACSVVSWAQKTCQGHLNAKCLWLHGFGHRLSRAETKAFHRHVLEQVTSRKGPGPKQAREAALEGCSPTRTVLRLTSDAQPASPGGGLPLSQRNVALGFQSQKSSLEFIIL